MIVCFSWIFSICEIYLECWTTGHECFENLYSYRPYSLSVCRSFLYASVNSSCAQHPPGLLPGICPPCQSWGWGICKFCAARGLGICQPPGPFLSFWHARGFLSENNYTEDLTGKESRLAHLSRTGKIEEVCKGMFLILCMHFFIAYRARIT